MDPRSLRHVAARITFIVTAACYFSGSSPLLALDRDGLVALLQTAAQKGIAASVVHLPSGTLVGWDKKGGAWALTGSSAWRELPNSRGTSGRLDLSLDGVRAWITPDSFVGSAGHFMWYTATGGVLQAEPRDGNGSDAFVRFTPDGRYYFKVGSFPLELTRRSLPPFTTPSPVFRLPDDSNSRMSWLMLPLEVDPSGRKIAVFQSPGVKIFELGEGDRWRVSRQPLPDDADQGTLSQASHAIAYARSGSPAALEVLDLRAGKTRRTLLEDRPTSIGWLGMDRRLGVAYTDNSFELRDAETLQALSPRWRDFYSSGMTTDRAWLWSMDLHAQAPIQLVDVATATHSSISVTIVAGAASDARGSVQFPRLVPQTGHAEPIMHAILSSSRELVLSASKNRLVLWNTATGAELWASSLRDGTGGEIGFVPGRADAAYFFGPIGGLYLFELSSGAILRHHPARGVSATGSRHFAHQLSTGGEYFFAMTDDVCEVYRTADDQLVHRVTLPKGLIPRSDPNQIALAPDARQVALAGSDAVAVIDLPSGTTRNHPTGGGYATVVFGPSGRRLVVAGSTGKEVVVLDVTQKNLEVIYSRSAKLVSSKRVRLSSHESHLLIEGTEGIDVIPLNSKGSPLHLADGRGIPHAFSPDGAALVLGKERPLATFRCWLDETHAVDVELEATRILSVRDAEGRMGKFVNVTTGAEITAFEQLTVPESIVFVSTAGRTKVEGGGSFRSSLLSLKVASGFQLRRIEDGAPIWTQEQIINFKAPEFRLPETPPTGVEGGVTSLRMFEGAVLAGYRSGRLELWDSAARRLIRTFSGNALDSGRSNGLSADLGTDGRRLLTGTLDRLSAWTLGPQQLVWSKPLGARYSIETVGWSGSGSEAAVVVMRDLAGSDSPADRMSGRKRYEVRDGATGNLRTSFEAVHIALDPGERLVLTGDDNQLTIRSAQTLEPQLSFKPALSGEIPLGDMHIVSDRAAKLAATNVRGTVRVWSLETRREVFVAPPPRTTKEIFGFQGLPENILRMFPVFRRIALSADGTRITITDSDETTVYEIATKAVVGRFVGSGAFPVEDGLLFPSEGADLWLDTKNASLRTVLATTSLSNPWTEGQVTYRATSGLLQHAMGNQVTLYDAKTGSRLVDFFQGPPREDATRDSVEPGWFWAHPSGLVDANYLETLDSFRWVFPDKPFDALSPRIFLREYQETDLAGKILSGRDLRPVQSPAQLDRRTPRVTALKASLAPDRQSAVVTATVTRPDSAEGEPVGAIHDLRIFRDDKLVSRYPAPRLPNGTASSSRLDDPKSSATSFTVTLPVALPADAKTQFRFTAYAYNHDRVLGEAAETVLERLVPPPSRPGRFVIVAVGVNNRSLYWQLPFAPDDARAIAKQLSAQVALSAKHAEVLVIPLLSAAVGAEAGLAPTAENLSTVFALLAGNEAADQSGRVSRALQRSVPRLGPNDDLLVWTITHGTRLPGTGDTYRLVLDDLRRDSPRKLRQDGLGLLGMDQFARWLEPLDLRSLHVVIDACYAAAAIETDQFKPGPWGTPGLGQLAYDKHAVVFSSSQAAEASAGVNRSLLTQALLGDVDESPSSVAAPDLRAALQSAIDRVSKLSADVSRATGGDYRHTPALFYFGPPNRSITIPLSQPSPRLP